MKQKTYILLAIVFAVLAHGCEDYLEPISQNQVDDATLYNDPIYVEGFLINAYQGLPNSFNYYSDAATDNAVTNNRNSASYAAANGAWSSEFNPFSGWNGDYTRITSINQFLSHCDQVDWHFKPDSSADHNKRYSDGVRNRLKGEAYGLRAFYYLQLLREHAGQVGGVIYGIPLVTSVITTNDDYVIPRATFTECVAQIVSDCDSALKLLPWVYEEYKKTVPDYLYLNHVNGDHFTDRVSGIVAMTIKADVQLLAASQAYNLSNETSLWADAANTAAQLIDSIGGVDKLESVGLTFYIPKSKTAHNLDAIWARSPFESNAYEKALYPPSYFGNGEVNPSQNLVDAFPAADGYPIESSADYDPAAPYAKRDKRFNQYIVANGSRINGVDTVFTYSEADKDGINELPTSTRTGYYTGKFINPKVSVVPGKVTLEASAHVLYRFTEVLLFFAEAANEAWGPTDNRKGYSAQDAIAEIRSRAGIPSSDEYLKTVVGSDQDAFRVLVRNERRLETCFEGKRFWDIRRWQMVDNMKETARGVNIVAESNGSYTYNYVNVEPRRYENYMIYPPIPYSEVIKTGLTQNDNWK